MMVFIYASIRSITLLSKNTNNTQSYITVIFQTLDKSECCGAIIDNRSYATICVLEEKFRKIKSALKNMLRKFFEGTCIVEYAFKVTADYFTSHIMDIY